MPTKVFECTITVFIALSPFLSDFENTIKINNENNTIIFESTNHAIFRGNTVFVIRNVIKNSIKISISF